MVEMVVGTSILERSFVRFSPPRRLCRLALGKFTSTTVVGLCLWQWFIGWRVEYSEALKALLEPSVISACDYLWLYHNLLGMVLSPDAG